MKGKPKKRGRPKGSKNKPKKKLKLVRFYLSKTKSGFHEGAYYIKVVKADKMMEYYDFLFEVRQLEWHVFNKRHTHKFKLSKDIWDGVIWSHKD